jgi:hypothetical protein
VPPKLRIVLKRIFDCVISVKEILQITFVDSIDALNSARVTMISGYGGSTFERVDSLVQPQDGFDKIK